MTSASAKAAPPRFARLNDGERGHAGFPDRERTHRLLAAEGKSQSVVRDRASWVGVVWGAEVNRRDPAVDRQRLADALGRPPPPRRTRGRVLRAGLRRLVDTEVQGEGDEERDDAEGGQRVAGDRVHDGEGNWCPALQPVTAGSGEP